MKKITDKEYEEYIRLKTAVDHDHVLTPDGLRFICEACGYDAQKIGEHFLTLLPELMSHFEASLPIQYQNK